MDRIQMRTNLRQLLRGECDFGRSSIFHDPLDAFRPGNRDNPRLLGQQPCKGNPCGRSLLLLGQLLHILGQCHVLLQVLRAETGNGTPEVGLVECRLPVETSCQHGLAQRTERYEADTQLFQGRQQLRFGLAVPHRILALDCRKRTYGMCPADCCGRSLGQAPMENLALPDKPGQRIGDLLDGRIRINTVLVIEVDMVSAQTRG